MKNLEDLIPDTQMSYKERIELAVADARGEFSVSEEYDSVQGAKKYALERIEFWKNWNEEWNKTHEKTNTFERYISAQKDSDVYADAVFKSIASLITHNLLSKNETDLEKWYESFHELCFVYMCASLKMMKSPELAIKHLVQTIKKSNFSLGFYIEFKVKDLNKERIKEWLKKAA